MAKNLVSCDMGTEKIYIHNGISSTILLSFAAPDLNPAGATWDGDHLISVSNYRNKIYIHDGVSSTVLSSFASPDQAPFDLAFDGTNLISCDSWVDKIYLHDGVTSTIQLSFATGNGIAGLAYDGVNLIHSDVQDDKIYVHDGISSTILTSFSSPDTTPSGLAYYGGNLISSDENTDKIYIHNGLSSTITSSFSSPASAPWGLGIVPEAKPEANTLKCEGQTNPANVTDKTPEFSAVYRNVYGYTSTYYRIQIARDINFTDIVWDSGKKGLEGFGNGDTVSLGESEVSLPLDGTKYYWRVKFWDSEGHEGDWSSE